MPKLRSPIWRIGGKGLLTAKLLKLIPPHKVYVEAFCGGASLFFAKLPVPLEVLNDTDRTLIQFFRMLRDPAKFKRFHELVSLTPYSRSEYNDAYTWREEADELERLRKWFIFNRQAFAGKYRGGWSHGICATDNLVHARAISSWLSVIDLLPEIVERLRQAQIECLDYKDCLLKYDNLGVFFYLDPPYILETRKAAYYKYEMTLNDHKQLVGLLLKIKGNVLLSGYKHNAYEPLVQAGWQTKSFSYAQGAAFTKGAGQAPRRIETVWFNYDIGIDKV